jgi:WD40 repeat protein
MFNSKIELQTPPGDLLHNLIADPLGRTLYAVGQEGRIWQFDLGSGAVREFGHGDIADATAIALTPDGSELIVGGSAGEVGAISVDGRSRGSLLKSRLRRPISTLVAGKYRGGRVIAAAMEDESVVQVWLPGHDDPKIVSSRSKVTSLGLTDNTLAVGDMDGNVTFHDLADSKAVRTLRGSNPEISAIAFDGPRRVATGTADGKIRVFDFSTGETEIELQATPRRILSMQFSPAGDMLMTASEDHSTRIWPIYKDVGELIRIATTLLPKASDRK